MEGFKFLSLLFTIKINFILIMEIESCQITLETDLPDNHSPLLFHSNLKDFIYPNFDDGTIKINPGESIVVACPYRNSEDRNMNIYEIIEKKPKAKEPVEETKEISKLDHVSITCKDDKSPNLFTIQITKNIKRTVLLKNIRCHSVPKSEFKQSKAKCANKNKETMAFIGFRVKEKFYEIIQFCHDKTKHRTLYAKSTIVKRAKYYQKEVPDRDFREDEYFPNMKLKNAYSHTEQFKIITGIVGKEEETKKYIRYDRNKFLARGHLVAKADFILRAQQLATYTYVNALPMWQQVNHGNWAALEDSVRNCASEKKLDLEVWTGGIENFKIKNINGKPQDIYLYRNAEGKKSITVPKYLFKVVYDKSDKAGVVFITINNPRLKIEDIKNDGYVFCEDVCHSLSWLSKDLKSSFTDSITRGYTFCCKVDGFRYKFPELPQFLTKKLLL